MKFGPPPISDTPAVFRVEPVEPFRNEPVAPFGDEPPFGSPPNSETPFGVKPPIGEASNTVAPFGTEAPFESPPHLILKHCLQWNHRLEKHLIQ